jgi:mannitol-specific phosphotransferase system IIBC component
MLEILAPAIRILVFWAITRFATMGYLTPEDASELTKVVMDLIVYGLPLLYAWWAARQVVKAKRQ